MNRFKLLFILAICIPTMVSRAENNPPGEEHKTYFVSPGGNNANPGTRKKPVATIQTGVNKLQPGDTLRILSGTYRETVIFPRSGTGEKPITVMADKGAKVVVSGCETIVKGWTRHKGNIWKAPMQWTLGPGRNQVFSEGRVMIEARFPNKPAPGLEMYVSDLSPLWPTFGEFSIAEPGKNPGRIVSSLLEKDTANQWKGAIYYGVHFQGYSAQTGIIESSEPGAINVSERTEQWWFAPGPQSSWQPTEEGRGMIVGHMNALDLPGEWHYQDGFLYFIPPSGNKPVNVEAKSRHIAFDLSDREHINIKGIEIKAASARLANSGYCSFDNCRFEYISHFTRFFSLREVERDQNTIITGETGIYVSGHDNTFINCSIRYSAGAGIFIWGYHHTIHNCLIDEVCYTAHYFNAITDVVDKYDDYENLLVGGHVITYNTLRNGGRHFFNINANGRGKSSRDRGSRDYMATLFAHNHLYNGMLLTRDAGFITGYYTSGGTLNGLRTRIINNVMHDNYDLFGMRIKALGMIYLDAGTCDVEVFNNLFWAAPGSHQRAMWFNTCCVNVVEKDNVFHPQFTRNSATLIPSDFPGNKPFRFGHDFSNPPPLAEWPPLKHLVINLSQTTSRSGDPANVKDRDWFSLGDVNFDDNWQSAVITLASNLKDINSDRSARSAPRHNKTTDPLVLEAIVNDGKHKDIQNHWTYVRNVTDSSWLKFSNVQLGNGYRRFRVVYGNTSEIPRQIEIRLDSLKGPLAGSVNLSRTDIPRFRGSENREPSYIQIYGQALGEITKNATGTRDVYIVFHSVDGDPVGEFEYFRFEQYRGEIPLLENEVKLEFRIDSKDGEKIGEFYPWFTGDNKNYRDFVAKFEPLKGTHSLFLVVRSALPSTVCSLGCISLQRTNLAGELKGIGDQPLRQGDKMILPQPTNLPCSRPADKYEGKKP